MFFGVLGPLEVRDDAGAPVAVTAEKPQRLLTALLLRANSWVSVDTLVDAVWPDGPPASARNNVKTYVHQLRKLLAVDGDRSRVDSRQGWYRVAVDPGELDADAFERSVRDGEDAYAAGDAGAAVECLRGALDSWRGEPYAVLPAHVTDAERVRLAELRWTASYRLADALTAVGRHDEAAAGLQALAVEDPLREPTWERLVTTLHAAGRRADALAAYRRARDTLVDELGVEPGGELRRAHQAVLADEPVEPDEAAEPVDAAPEDGGPAREHPAVRRSRLRRVLGGHRRVVTAVAAVVALVVAATVIGVVVNREQPGEANGPANAPADAPADGRRPVPPEPLTGADRGKVLFGLGDDAAEARGSELVRDAPVGMLTTWYNGAKDLPRIAEQAKDVVPSAYRDGQALHLVVAAWDDPKPFDTGYGPACGKPYPLSDRFTADMRQVARELAGRAGDPSLYVTMFMGFDTYACTKDKYKPNARNVNYYEALKDRYLEVLRIFHQVAPNSRVSLGWDGWEARIDDDPANGGGPSMFAHFADVMRASDFQSFGMRETGGSNPANIEAMVNTLGTYGPVMIAYYMPWRDPLPLFDREVRMMLTDDYLGALVDRGLFAWSFNGDEPMVKSPRVERFVERAVQRYGRSDR